MIEIKLQKMFVINIFIAEIDKICVLKFFLTNNYAPKLQINSSDNVHYFQLLGDSEYLSIGYSINSIQYFCQHNNLLKCKLNSVNNKHTNSVISHLYLIRLFLNSLTKQK